MSYTVILHTELGAPPGKKSRYEDGQSAASVSLTPASDPANEQGKSTYSHIILYFYQFYVHVI